MRRGGGEVKGDDETVSTGCGPPQCAASWTLSPHMQEIVPVFSGGPFVLSRGGGPDRLASGLQYFNDILICTFFYLYIYIYIYTRIHTHTYIHLYLYDRLAA